MPGISRVLWNRLDNPDQFPRLECDATWNYINNIIPQPETVTPQQEAYYTYIRKGLPVGPICNRLGGYQAGYRPLRRSGDRFVLLFCFRSGKR